MKNISKERVKIMYDKSIDKNGKKYGKKKIVSMQLIIVIKRNFMP